MLAALVALTTIVGQVPASAADTSGTEGVGAAPARNGAPDGRTRFSVVVGAGQQVEDTLLVRNTGSTDAELVVYAADAHTSVDGAYALDETSVAPGGVGSWVTFAAGAAPVTLDVAAGDQTLVPFTVTVPTDATPGDHAGGVVVSTGSADGMERRVATRLYVRVQGLVQPALAITDMSASQPVSGNPLVEPTTITATLANTGDVALGAHVVAGARTFFGIASGDTVELEVPEILPGETRTLTVRVDGVGRVGYLAPYLELTPVADQGAYDFAASLVTVHAKTTLFTLPWLVLGVVALLAVGARLLVSRRRVAADSPGPTTVGDLS